MGYKQKAEPFDVSKNLRFFEHDYIAQSNGGVYMRFAHFSDCHLGSWNNHPELRELSIRTFEVAIDKCVSDGVDFILIAGDLFDTSMPSMDVLRRAVTKFRQCKEAGVPVYAIAGSHDFSPTGKTFLSVMEDAGLLVDVGKFDEINGKIRLRFITDKKTGAKIAGVTGKMGGLEVKTFESLDRSIEEESGCKILLVHTSLLECISFKDARALPIDMLPRNFDYYAAGHVHIRYEGRCGDAKVVYPGPTFPTEFTELENFCAGYYLVDTTARTAVPCDINLCGVALIRLDASGKTPRQVTQELNKEMPADLKNKILLLRVGGVIDGKITDIDFQNVSATAMELGAIAVKKNISKLTSKELQASGVDSSLGISAIENELVMQSTGKIKFPKSLGDEEDVVFSLMPALDNEKQEGETVSVFEERLKANAKKMLGL